MPERPVVGEVEQRSAPQAVAPEVEGRRLRGVIPYGVPSGDLGGWSEVIEPRALNGARMDRLVATVDHGGIPLARHPRTLEIEDRDDGLHWSCELPESRADVREAIERGDLEACSWRMVVGRDEWRGTVRHVLEIKELRDVSVVTLPAYAEARAELRELPENTEPDPGENTNQEEATVPTENEGGGLRVEDRTAEEPSVESRIEDALRSINVGEVRSLNTTSASPVAPEEQATFLWDRLRPASVMLAAGVRVIPTTRDKIVWPRLTSDVDPTWVAEEEVIPAGDPGFGTLEADPKKLAHRVELSNEVIDDSTPSIVEVVSSHMATMLALKLDRSMLIGNPATDTDSIRGLKYTSGIQTIDMGTNGSALADYDPFLEAVGMLRAANVQPPYVIVANPRDYTGLTLLKEESGSNLQLGAPADFPAIYTTTQLPVNETKGTSSNASSAYVFAPGEVVLVRRADAQIELDRSRLFDRDMSEMRAKVRADLIVPNPVAVVRVNGIVPA